MRWNDTLVQTVNHLPAPLVKDGHTGNRRVIHWLIHSSSSTSLKWWDEKDLKEKHEKGQVGERRMGVSTACRWWTWELSYECFDIFLCTVPALLWHLAKAAAAAASVSTTLCRDYFRQTCLISPSASCKLQKLSTLQQPEKKHNYPKRHRQKKDPLNGRIGSVVRRRCFIGWKMGVHRAYGLKRVVYSVANCAVIRTAEDGTQWM